MGTKKEYIELQVILKDEVNSHPLHRFYHCSV